MDSGNSGSMQSSSCGEEEFDSRPDSISSFFNPSPNQPPHQHHHHQQQQLFDPLSTYYDVFSRPTNPHHHHHQQQQQQLSWAPPPPPAISHGGAAHPPNFLFNPPNMGTGITTSPLTTTSNAPVVNNDQNVVRPTTTGGPASSSQQDPGPNPAIGSTRNPKKRSRASRRAPTTVLTTDTSNFRAMVQEFTGIPSPPFSSSSSLPFPHRTRLDLFGGVGVGGVGSASTPSYLLRPFAHKLHPPTPPTFLSSPHHVHINDNIVNSTASITSSISNTNYQHLSELGLLHKPPQNVVLNVQSIGGTNTTTSTSTTTTTTTVHDQDHHHHQQQQQQQQQHPITMLSFQSLLQSQAAPSSKPPNASTHDHDLPLFGGLKMGSLMEDLGGGVSSHNNYEDRHLQMGNLRGFNGSFGGGGVGVGGGSSSPSNATAVASTSQIVSSTSKNVSSNFCGAPSDCHNKGSENVPSRGEGIVDSWICPSD